MADQPDLLVKQVLKGFKAQQVLKGFKVQSDLVVTE
jgi:hypothetical protein